jgi:hypothetical protein
VDPLVDDDGAVTDDELAAMALLAGDPDQPLDPDAVPIALDPDVAGLLPEWYMPALTSSVRKPVRRWTIAGIVVALVVVNGAGLCATYGIPEIAW